MSKKGLHDGHKKRLRDRFEVSDDCEGFSDYEVLELLLNYSNVRKNTNDIAHMLIDHFGSIDAVLDASREELYEIKGIGPSMASIILLQKNIFKRYEQSRHNIIDCPHSCSDFVPYLCSLFMGASEEKAYMMCVGENGRITKIKHLKCGSGNSIILDQRDIIKTALNSGAWGVIFAHNHPTGILTPSHEDIKGTKLLEKSLNSVDIKLVDHLIVVGDKCESILNDTRYKIQKY